MDTLYTGKIPKEYKYIYLQDGYIYLFNKPFADNELVDCYKIDNSNGFLYCYSTFEATGLINFEKVNVSSKHYYRTDYTNILFCSCMLAVVFIFICNIVTSLYRKGGVLSGLF